LADFISSRRQGLSPLTISFYNTCLKPFVKDYQPTPDDINRFIAGLKCNTGSLLALSVIPEQNHAILRLSGSLSTGSSETTTCMTTPSEK